VQSQFSTANFKLERAHQPGDGALTGSHPVKNDSFPIIEVGVKWADIGIASSLEGKATLALQN
jgi:hypothetical protein